MKIILVDDNPSFSDCLKTYLESILGYEVMAVFYDGEELLDSTDYLYCDLILMDIKMPGINGICATKLIKCQVHDLKIIAMTKKNNADLLEIIGAGCMGCLYKDTIIDNLKVTIEKVGQGIYHYPRIKF